MHLLIPVTHPPTPSFVPSAFFVVPARRAHPLDLCLAPLFAVRRRPPPATVARDRPPIIDTTATITRPRTSRDAWLVSSTHRASTRLLRGSLQLPSPQSPRPSSSSMGSRLRPGSLRLTCSPVTRQRTVYARARGGERARARR